MKKPTQEKCNHNDSFMIYSLLSKTHNVPCILSKLKIYSDSDLNITQILSTMNEYKCFTFGVKLEWK